ncbi:hypothetical protein bwei_5400 [Bacillus mycoides]|nr:hypothetical protein bwei_5344 [Bacillus mycoides]AIW87939.1 hypothetical protein bwei_5400 [Bacillus mycoides]
MLPVLFTIFPFYKGKASIFFISSIYDILYKNQGKPFMLNSII